jgi:hypothetical protein
LIKLNGRSSSSGLALLTYPFTSMSGMYKNTVFIQTYFFRSVERFYAEMVRVGGVVQRYEEGLKSIAVCAKVFANGSHIVLGTLEKISSGFINVGYIFPQKVVPHEVIIEKSKEVLDRLGEQGHVGFVELTVNVFVNDSMYLEEVELYSTKITNSIIYFKFLTGGHFSGSGEFVTTVATEGERTETDDGPEESREYCYIPFLLHFGLSDQQANSFFQLCRIGGVSFDLENKIGTTFVVLGSMKDCVGILTTAKERKKIINFVSKTAEFLMKQNSHNICTEMLREK